MAKKTGTAQQAYDDGYEDGLRAAFAYLHLMANGTPGTHADTARDACAFLKAKFKQLGS